MKIELNLTKREAEAVLRCAGLSNGHGIVKSQALQAADMKLRHAIINAQAVEDGTQ